jgi:hypothetical protein
MGKVLDGSELAVFDCINQDMIELTGEEINYYSYDPSSIQNRQKIDPLYGETTSRVFGNGAGTGAARIMALVKYPEYDPMSEESGFSREWDAMVTISRSILDEKHLPYPSEADIIEMWRTPYHDAWSMGKGMFFDVLKSKPDGYLNDSPSFTQFIVTLKRRSQFGAERRITPP